MSTPIINVSVTGNDIPSQQYKTVILKPNLVDDVNILTQAMLDIHGANTKFVIKYDFTLAEDITVPNNCVLEFDGGSISANGNNDTITGNNTGINAGLVKIFGTTINIDGTWCNDKVYVCWFGYDYDFNKIFGFKASEVIFTDGEYSVNSPIYMRNSNVVISKEAIITAQSAIEYMFVADYTKPFNAYTLDRFRYISGNGILNGNNKANIIISSNYSEWFTVKGLVLKNAKVACYATVSNGAGNCSLEDCAFLNEIHSTTAVAIKVDSPDSSFRNLEIIDYKVGIEVNKGGCDYTNIKHWTYTSSMFNDTTLFKVTNEGINAYNCTADTIQHFATLHGEFAFINAINCNFICNYNVVSKEYLSSHKPIFIDNSGVTSYYAEVIGGCVYIDVAFKLFYSDNGQNTCNITRLSYYCEDQESMHIGYRTLVLNSVKNGAPINKGSLGVSKTDDTHQFLTYMNNDGNVYGYDGYSNMQRRGPSTWRPALTWKDAGFCYFDTTLNKPIWYKGGGEWVDATGATV